MDLRRLLNDENLPEIDILDISCDSRQVKKGALFFAINGNDVNGEEFIDSALENGAICIVTENEELSKNQENFICVDNIRRLFSLACYNFYGKKQPENVVAITGTNGKTSIVNFCQQIWQNMGYNSACIGTIGIVAKDLYEYGSRTTPDSKTLYKTVAKLTDSKITHLAIEASSHGISQYRFEDLILNSAGWTNLTPEHLDYHKDLDDYFNAKSRLFSEMLTVNKSAVLNSDVQEFNRIKKVCEDNKLNIITYGQKAKDIIIRNMIPKGTGQTVELSIFDVEYKIDLPLIGDFQVYNICCALGLIMGNDLSLKDNQEKMDEIVQGLSNIKGVSGRLEHIGTLKNHAHLYVDYAHNPDGLRKVLESIKPHVENNGRLVCVMGCGGDRDTTKRPVMGQITAELADVSIITSDNPRSEDPMEIINQVKATCPEAVIEPDRAKAIRKACMMLQPDDILVVAGKGHETTQIIGDKVIPFSDKEELLKFMST